jgi:hypothetical protein
MKVSSNAFYFIDVTWKGGFKHIVPCRGYGLQSQLKFNDSLIYVESAEPREVTEEEYNNRIWGDLDGRDNQREAQQENPPKRSRAKAKSKDSESTRNTSGKSPRVTGSQPSKLLKPTVRNVSKSKKDIQGIDNPRTKAVSKPRRAKG